MTALTADKNTPRMNDPRAVVDSIAAPLAVIKVIEGGLVGIDMAGYLRPAAPGSDQKIKIIGIAELTVDNTAGIAGAKTVKVLRGTFKFVNGATTDAITQADCGRLVYALDDATVVRTPAFGARSPAGRVIQVDTDGVWVDTTKATDSETDLEILCLSTGDLSAKQFFFVKQDASNGVVVCTAAGEIALGVVQNAPAAAAMAIVKVLGKTRCIAGTTIAQAGNVAVAATGKAGVAALMVQATGAGSYMMGKAMTAAAADLSPFELVLTHSGGLPTSAA